MGAFREAIAKEVRKELMNPEFDSRRSKNGGRVFWVKAAAATGFGQFVKEHPAYDDNKAAVHTTMSSAAGAVVADRGDEVRVTEGHTEEFEKAFCLSTSGVRWVGEGYGTKVPVLTISGAIHGVSMEAAGCEFENFRFAVPPIDAALNMIRVRGAGCKIKDIVGLGSDQTNNFVDCILVATGANDLTLENIKFYSGNVAVTSFLHFEAAISRFTAAGFFAEGSVATAGVYDDSGARIKGGFLKDLTVVVHGSDKPALALDTAGSYGVVDRAFFAGTRNGAGTSIAGNALFNSNGWRLNEVKVLEETVSTAQGGVIPAADAD